jgi:hypothetical protein
MTPTSTRDTRAGEQPARPHWRCPTPGCTDACYCERDSPARLLRHVGCDRPANPLGDVPNTIAARRRAQELAAQALATELADPDATQREPERPARVPA